MSKRRKLFAFAIDEHLKVGLARVKERDGISESEQARRAVRQWLQERSALTVPSSPNGKQKKARQR
jgi:hypothetical protein